MAALHFQGAPGQTTESPHPLLQPWDSHLSLRRGSHASHAAPLASSPQHGCPGPSIASGLSELAVGMKQGQQREGWASRGRP